MSRPTCRRAVGSVVAVLAVAALLLGYHLTSAAFAKPPGANPPADPDALDATVDLNAHADLVDLGLHKVRVTLNVPGDDKLTATYRVYHNGKVDPKLSLRTVFYNDDKRARRFCELGYFDPGATNPKPAAKVRLLPAGGTGWIDLDKPLADFRFGAGDLKMQIGTETVMAWLALNPIMHDTIRPDGKIIESTPKLEHDGTAAGEVKVTLSLRVEPMTPDDIDRTRTAGGTARTSFTERGPVNEILRPAED